MRFIPLGAVLIALAGCSSSAEPLIDHINVSDSTYNRDLADCRDQTKGGWMPFSGGSMGDCMKSKGYRVLMNNSGL